MQIVASRQKRICPIHSIRRATWREGGSGMISSFLREANNLIILIFPSSPDTQLGQVKTGRWLNSPYRRERHLLPQCKFDLRVLAICHSARAQGDPQHTDLKLAVKDPTPPPKEIAAGV